MTTDSYFYFLITKYIRYNIMNIIIVNIDISSTHIIRKYIIGVLLIDIS